MNYNEATREQLLEKITQAEGLIRNLHVMLDDYCSYVDDESGNIVFNCCDGRNRHNSHCAVLKELNKAEKFLEA